MSWLSRRHQSRNKIPGVIAMGSSPGKFNTKARISKPSALFSWLIQLKARRKHQPGQKKHHIPTTMIFKSNCPTITYIASKRLQVRTTSSHKDLEPVTQISTKAQLNWTVRFQLQKVMGDNVCVCVLISPEAIK